MTNEWRSNAPVPMSMLAALREVIANEAREKNVALARVAALEKALRDADDLLRLYCLERYRLTPEGWADLDRAAERFRARRVLDGEGT